MTYYRESELRAATGPLTASGARNELSREAKAVAGIIDIFISHSFRDAQVILGLKRLLEREGLRVYVDWVDDPDLDRGSVTPATAARLRRRMDGAASLVYATSPNASRSRWMPWELGYFDGVRGADRVSICPITTDGDGGYVGQEYLGLYKRIERLQQAGRVRPFAVEPSRARAEPIPSFAAGRGEFVRLR